MTLERPIKDYVDGAIDAAALARIRAGVAARQARSRSRGWVAPLAVAVALAAALVLWFSVAQTTFVPRGPLTVGAQPLGAIDSVAPRTVTLDDGSSIAVRADTHVMPRSNDGRELVLELERGTVELEVVPGGGRRWLVEARWATVEVTGTHFIVARDERGVTISVQRGEVVVRGEHVVGRERHVVAGQTLRVDAPVEAALVPAPTPATADVPRAAEPSTAVAATAPDRVPHVVPPTTDADLVGEQLAASDSARAAGHPRDAAVLLRAIVTAHANDARASVAAFTLARLDLDVLADPAEGIEMLDRATALGLPAAMREDASARMVEALARAGRLDDARAAATRFEADMPDSPRLSEVRRWAQLDGR